MFYIVHLTLNKYITLSAVAAEEKRSSSVTKLTLTREEHKAEIFWALKSVICLITLIIQLMTSQMFSKQCFQIAS